MIRRRWSSGMAGVLLVAGCGEVVPPTPPAPPAVTVPVTTTPAATGPTTTAPAASGPLTGTWSRSDTTMEVAIRFLDDGRYRSVEILSYPEADGTYELRRVEDGTATVSGERVRLVGRTATVTRTSADHPERNYKDRPTATRTGAYTWQIDGVVLRLIDAAGAPADFTRQS